MRKTCLQTVCALAKRDQRVVFIGSDLGPGTMDELRREISERFFMEGVAEAHVIGMAAGLAMDGFIPYVNTIATFLTRRCYEQLAVDLCMHRLPVRLIGNGAGLVYAPLGPTHLATEDIAIMRALPNMTVVAPTDADEMRRLVDASLDYPGPVYIRLAKGGDPIVSRADDGFVIGKAIMLREPGDILLVASGVMVHRALQAADIMQANGIRCGILNMHTIKPLDKEKLLEYSNKVGLIVTIEEHSLIGGLGSAVVMLLKTTAKTCSAKIHCLGIPDVFPYQYGSQDKLMEHFGLQPHQIAANTSKYWRDCQA